MKKDKEICSAYSGNHKVFLQDLIESSAISAEILDYTLNFDKYSACLSHKVLTEKAYDIEAKTRILLNHALNALNFSYDSSMLYEPLSNMYNKIESEKAYSIEKDLLNAEKYFKENQPEVDTTFLAKFRTIVRKEKLSLETDKNGHIIVTKNGIDGHTQTAKISKEPVFGSLGRITAKDFFGKGDFRIFHNINTFFNDENCHHKPTQIDFSNEISSIDFYEHAIGYMALIKVSAYHHARLIEEFGIPHLKGEGPAVIGIIVISIIAAGAVLAAVTCPSGFGHDDTACQIGLAMASAGLLFIIFSSMPKRRDPENVSVNESSNYESPV